MLSIAIQLLNISATILLLTKHDVIFHVVRQDFLSSLTIIKNNRYPKYPWIRVAVTDLTLSIWYQSYPSPEMDQLFLRASFGSKSQFSFLRFLLHRPLLITKYRSQTTSPQRQSNSSNIYIGKALDMGYLNRNYQFDKLIHSIVHIITINSLHVPQHGILVNIYLQKRDQCFSLGIKKVEHLDAASCVKRPAYPTTRTRRTRNHII